MLLSFLTRMMGLIIGPAHRGLNEPSAQILTYKEQAVSVRRSCGYCYKIGKLVRKGEGSEAGQSGSSVLE